LTPAAPAVAVVVVAALMRAVTAEPRADPSAPLHRVPLWLTGRVVPIAGRPAPAHRLRRRAGKPAG
jgi:cytochrome c oxidase assembly factor CtaG